ncbi:MAG TPA: DNA translocase FtsK 4TM domain-containing protein [Hyphomicrobium sp.]|nr:DNA translocase FtsK 4TM domain-containing protein [Hyphomicrobium sp.]
MSLDTRGIDPQRLLPQSLEDRLLGWLARFGGACLLAFVGVVWLSLISWSYSDPSLTHATTADARNWMGPLGAILSDLLLQTLGFSAVVALVAPVAWTSELLRASRIDMPRAKAAFYPLAVLAIAGALSAFPVPSSWPLHHGLGGVLGDGLYNLTSRLFAFLNEERAGLAAGLLLIAGAITAFAKSIGLDLEQTAEALVRASTRVAQLARDGDALPSSFGGHLNADDDDRVDAELRPSRRGWWPIGRVARDIFQSGVSVSQQAAYADGGAPTPVWSRDAHFPSHQPFHGSSRTAALSGSDGDDVPPFDFNVVPDRSGAPVMREPSFDVSTDAASRAIAARFAPGASNAVTPPAQPRPAARPKVSNLVSGQPFQAAEPGWARPSLNLLKRAPAAKPGPEFTQTVMRGNARLLEDVLADFGVKGEVKDIKPGPVVTLYELEPARGTKSSRVIGLADDIARSMSVSSVRAAVVPGRNAIGLELPNVRREPVLLREILEADACRSADHALPLALGKSIGGEPVVADLARMPHLLVAGTTGSGKSVGVNAMVLSLLYRHAPADCRLLLIDPKMLELSVYNGIPHLLTPVVTDPHKAVAALNWAVGEMEERYKRMAALSVRNIEMFNNRVRNAKKRGEMLARTVQTGFDRSGQAVFEKQKMDLEPLPHIVIVVDEFADLMSVAGKDVEVVVQRLAQMARAAGIHLIMATQRPSVDVITGTIKANFPTRISFKVTSKIDSRTILNEQGAEQLLGQGDMLFSTGAGQVIRVHGAFVSDEEVEAVTDALRRHGPPDYVDGIGEVAASETIATGERQVSEGDLYDRAVAIVLRDRKASTSYIQRRLSIGYNRAADIIERMERDGLVSQANAVGKRDILVPGMAAGSSNADAA